MKTIKNIIFRNIAIVFIVWANVCQAHGQSPVEMFSQGLEMADQAVANDDMHSFTEGLKLMEKAQKKDKKRADWCYEIGSRYYYYVTFGGYFFAWDRDKGIKWFKEGAKLGDFRSTLVLYKHYKPKSEPYSLLAPKSEWKQYFKERDKSWEYAGIALNAEIPSDFNDYLTLAEAASFTNNADLANRYAAKAADNKESGAIDFLIRDERALDYLTSPEAMYEAAGSMWKRNKNEFGHNDIVNGMNWFEKSAKSGYPLAQNQMGYIYLNGISTKALTIKPDTLKSVSWYKLAAKNKVTEAYAELGRLYINGKGIEKDAERGFQLLNESAEKGHINSKLYLAYCYLYGLGTPQSSQHARDLFLKYFDSFNHAPDQRLIYVDNRIIDLDYLLGLTHYYENSAECIPLFEASLKNKDFNRLQRGDLLRKMSSCYRDALCGITQDTNKANDLSRQSLKYSGTEICEENIEI